MLHQNQNDQRPIVYIVVVEYISSVEMLRFVIVCHYPGGPHVAAAPWQCTYFFDLL